MQRCTVTARLYGRCSTPVNTSLNWFMPAFVNSNEVSSPGGTREEDGTCVCPSCSKNSIKRERISRLLNMGGRPPATILCQLRCPVNRNKCSCPKWAYSAQGRNTH